MSSPPDIPDTVDVEDLERVEPALTARMIAAEAAATTNPDRQAARPLQVSWAGLWAVARRIRIDMRQHHTSLLAAGVAFRGFLALFPSILIGVSGLVLALPAETILTQSRRLTSELPPSAQQIVLEQVDNIASADSEGLRLALVIAFLVAIWTASNAMDGVLEGLTVANGEQETRGWWHRRGLALLYTLGGLVFVSSSLAVVAGFRPLLRRLPSEPVADGVATAAQFALLGAMMLVALFVLYRRGPDRRPAQWHWTWPGAVLATITWLVGTELFARVVAQVGTYDRRYGAVAGIAILMLWLLLTSWCVLFGATVNAELEHETLVDTTIGPDRPLGLRGAVPADTIPLGPGHRDPLRDGPRGGWSPST